MIRMTIDGISVHKDYVDEVHDGMAFQHVDFVISLHGKEVMRLVRAQAQALCEILVTLRKQKELGGPL